LDLERLNQLHRVIDACWHLSDKQAYRRIVRYCDAATLLDFVEEPLDQIAGKVEVAAKAPSPSATTAVGWAMAKSHNYGPNALARAARRRNRAQAQPKRSPHPLRFSRCHIVLLCTAK